jgi:hypothetical protein
MHTKVLYTVRVRLRSILLRFHKKNFAGATELQSQSRSSFKKIKTFILNHKLPYTPHKQYPPPHHSSNNPLPTIPQTNKQPPSHCSQFPTIPQTNNPLPTIPQGPLQSKLKWNLDISSSWPSQTGSSSSRKSQLEPYLIHPSLAVLELLLLQPLSISSPQFPGNRCSGVSLRSTWHLGPSVTVNTQKITGKDT